MLLHQGLASAQSPKLCIEMAGPPAYASDVVVLEQRRDQPVGL